MDSKRDVFTRWADDYARFRADHGRDPSKKAASSAEKSMGAWLSNQRVAAKRGALLPHRRARLDEINLYWTDPGMDAFLRRVADYRQFRTDHGCDPSKEAASSAERSMGSWLKNQRSAANKGRLSAHRVALLDQANPHWHNRNRVSNDDLFTQRVADYRQFRTDHGRDPSGWATDPHEKTLGSWIESQRRHSRTGHLSSYRVALLDEANPHWREPNAHPGTGDDAFTQRLGDFRRFRVDHGRDPSATATSPHEKSLGYWIRNQRYYGRTGQLSSHRRALLDEATPFWRTQYSNGETADDVFRRRLAEYAQFRTDHGRDPCRGAPDPEEHPIRVWIDNQRSAAKKGQLSSRRADWLDEANPYWADPLMSAFLSRVSDYRQFRADHGRDPSALGADPQEKSLGSWISQQRSLRNQGSLAPEREAALDDANPHWRTQTRATTQPSRAA